MRSPSASTARTLAKLHSGVPLTSVAAVSASPIREQLYRRVPALDSLRRYSAASLRGDALAGLTVATVAVPQAMAYAMVAGLPAEYGLYTAIVMTAVGALFASSRQLINGPTNAISIALLSVLSTVPTDQKAHAAVLLALLVGAIQLGITLLRLGDLSRYICNSVIVGFTAGAGALLVLDQIKNLFGLKPIGASGDHFLYRLWLTLTEGGGIHPQTAAIGIGAIAAVVLLRGLKTRLGLPLLPELLLVVIGTAGVVFAFGLDARGVAVVGEIPPGLPDLRVPDVSGGEIRDFAGGALAIALLGLLEAIAMAKALAATTHERLDMNQQCLSEGLANLAGSLFSCMPGSGSLTRSAINQQAGGVTQWSALASAAAVALIVLAFAPFARFIPRAALAGILIVSAWKMVDRRALLYHLRATRFDAAIVAATAFSAVFISIEFCVLIGVMMSFLLAVPRAGRMLLTEFVLTDEGGVHERLPDDDPCGHILIFGLEGEMFFGATAALEQHLGTIENRITPEIQVVVLRLKRARNPDAVGLALLEGFLERTKARGPCAAMRGAPRVLEQDGKDRAQRADRRARVPRAARAADEHLARNPLRL